MKRLLALILTCALLVCSITPALALDYTLAEKLYRQLLAGSGFSAVITLEADTESFSTMKPIVLDVDYLYDRPSDEVTVGEQRLDLSLMDDDTVLTQAHVQLLGGGVNFQADVLSPEWYALRPAETTQTQMQNSAILSTAAAFLMDLQLTRGIDKKTDAALQDALESFITRIDIWIEGYRQSANLDKLEDGTTTMQVDYAIPSSAVKSQLKQLVYELLHDETTLSALRRSLSSKMSVYLNPLLEGWYFDCIDALPLEGELTISRVFSVKGDTLSLSLQLPMYSSELGPMTLCYDRVSGAKDDLPDENVLRLESAVQNASLTYQEYSSMTGVNVMQGSLRADGETAFETDFTLRQELLESRDADDRHVYEYNASVTLSAPQDESFDETEIVLASRFVSEERKTAATDVSATLTVSSADEAIELTLEGQSRKKWELANIPQPAENADWQSLLPGAGVRTLAVLADFIKLPEANAAGANE